MENFLIRREKDVSVAGGFALARYFKRRKNYERAQFSDVDMFLHSLVPHNDIALSIITKKYPFNPTVDINIDRDDPMYHVLEKELNHFLIKHEAEFMEEIDNKIKELSEPIARNIISDFIRYITPKPLQSQINNVDIFAYPDEEYYPYIPPIDDNIHQEYPTLRYTINDTDNVISFNITLYKSSDYSTNFSVQFIKRIYRSPSEIIHGFDIDSSCIIMRGDA